MQSKEIFLYDGKVVAHICTKVYNGKDNELKFRKCIWLLPVDHVILVKKIQMISTL